MERNNDVEISESLESLRLQELDSYKILGTQQEPVFDDIVKLVSQLYSVPMVAISLVDRDRQWFKSELGFGLKETPREYSFCSYAIMQPQFFEVQDALEDVRFSLSPLVKGDKAIRYYAGVPLISKNGLALGTLCVCDHAPRKMSPEQIENFRILGTQVVQLLEYKRLGLVLESETQKRIEANKELQRQVMAIHQSQEGIAILDNQSLYLMLNKAHAEMFGYKSVDELIGKSWTHLYPESEILRFQKEVFPFLMAHGFWSGEATAKKKDGTTFDEEVSLTLIEGGGLVCVCRDVSDRKKKDRELIAAKEKALAASKLKSEFIANVSHEIRTPMNGILGMSSLLLESNLNDESKEYVSLISSSGKSLLRIINEILDFSKIESGKVSVEHSMFNLCEVIHECVRPMMTEARDKKLKLIYLPKHREDVCVGSDPGRIIQVLTNLLGNALKFTHQGTVEVRTQILNPNAKTRMFRIEVQDSGVGIPKEMESVLFQPFTQADGSMSRKYGGTGLGLTICKKLVEMMGGSIGYESTPGKGTLFWFDLPDEKIRSSKQ
jgi:PAS domain S-box-containing protein